jgi:hypothetical protein
MKSRSDRRRQDVSLFRCFGALGAAPEVVFQCLPFFGREPVKDVIVQDFFCQMPNGEIPSSVLLIQCGCRGNPLPFDTSRLSERMLLRREDGGTGSTGN